MSITCSNAKRGSSRSVVISDQHRLAIGMCDHLALLARTARTAHQAGVGDGFGEYQPRRIVPVRRIFFCNCMMP